MKVTRFQLIRAIAYGLALAYFTLDLMWFKGPLFRQLNALAASRGAQRASGPEMLAGMVFGKEISLRALDQRIVIDSLRGGSPVDLTRMAASERYERRVVALAAIMDEICLDAKCTVRRDLVPVDAGAQALQAEEQRFGGAEAMNQRLAAAGWSRAEYQALLATEAVRVRYLEERIAASGANEVSDEEVRNWLAAHPDMPDLPEVLELRHLFKAALRQDPVALQAQMQAWYEELKAGTREFASLAEAESDDEASRYLGGKLGQVEMLQDRLPDGLNLEILAKAKLGEILPPMASRLGWHIFIVDARLPARPLQPNEWESELRAMLQAQKRREAVRLLMDALKNEGNARILLSNLESGPVAL